MPIQDRDWYKDKLDKIDEERLDDSSLWCKQCKGLTVNALTLICRSCGYDNSAYYQDRRPKKR